MLRSLSKKVYEKEADLKSRKKQISIKSSHKSSKKLTLNQKSKEPLKKKAMSKVKNLMTKRNITFFILILLDIILVIYSARKNIVNYVTVYDQDIFVSKTRYLLVGRNYINLLITGFFYLYICLINRFFLLRRNTKKFLGWLFVILVIMNFVLFFLFTKRFY